MRFRDRAHAGQLLAALLLGYEGRDDVLVLALPRGGVPVGYEVAARLRAPLEAFPVRKLGLPGHEELALGAIASGGVRVVNAAVAEAAGFAEDDVEALVEVETHELARQEQLYRGGRRPVEAGGRAAIVVDDGLATGASMRAAVVAVAAQSPRELVVAVPVGAGATIKALARDVDRVVVVHEPRRFVAVGYWYDDFRPTTDDEVRDLLAALPGRRSDL
jgi:predicted phosphoribosyltransferase